MVKYHEVDLDRIIYAISDSTRRRIMDELIKGEKSIGELREPFKMSLPAIMKHVDVLKGVGLLSTRKVSRRVMCNVTAGSLIRAATWLSKYQRFWKGTSRT